jgi:hypothetical protein
MRIHKQQQSKFRFTKNLEIGSPDAETDPYLMKAFIENDALRLLLDMSNQRSIIIGRTGSGKSALLKYIENTQDKVKRIEPEAMSLRYLVNSTILSYFRELGINLNFFYKVLWKHVFIVELLKLYFGDNELKKQNIFESIADKFRTKFGKSNPKKEQAIKYLKNWSNDFWANTEHRIKELETNVNSKFSSETGINVSELFKLKFKTDDEEKKRILSEVKNKAEKIINESQADEIHEIINIMKDELFIDEHKKFFILIDDLDKEWIPSDLRYDMIGAMIEVIKEFQVFKGPKIIISLRDNLYQLIFTGFRHKGGQREKFKPLYINMEWETNDLVTFLERRLEVISDRNITVKAAFDNASRGSLGFNYIIDRTFKRPRDIISFVNCAIENANNKTYFSLDIIKKSEIYYSKDRLQAIEDEWGENYGELSELFKFLYGKYNGFRLKNLREDEFASIYLLESPNQIFKGDLLTLVNKWKNDDIRFGGFIKELIYLLYFIGIIGIKKSANYPVCFFYDKEVEITPNDINNDCKIYVHKAFYSVLKINTKELESDVY